MLDKNIAERMNACFQKAKSILHVEKAFNYEVTDVALALFKEGYNGPWLDLISDINTLLDNRHGYVRAGNPDFLGLFGRDSIITAWQLLDYNPVIARNTLLQLAHLQGERMDDNTGEEPGKILHEYYPEDSTDATWFQKHKKNIEWLSIGRPVYYSIDSTPLYVILFDFYVSKTRDTKIIEKVGCAKAEAEKWLLRGIAKGKSFLGYESFEQGLKNQSWKDSEEYHIKEPVMPVEVQGYAYAALCSTHKKECDELKKNFSKKFWMDEEKYYAFALDGDWKQVREVTSNPGHLLFTGMLDEGGRLIVVDKLFSDELWTPYGIRTLSTKSKMFDPCSYHSGSVWPWDNWVIAQGLKMNGFMEEYKMIKDALFRAYNDLGIIPENYGVINNKIVRLPAQYPQAWSSGALLNFLMEGKDE
jgi:glycogen debranching enzyme